MSTADRLRSVTLGAGSGLVAAYRRTGADVPFGDPLPSHGTEMEGWFWRVTDRRPAGSSSRSAASTATPPVTGRPSRSPCIPAASCARPRSTAPAPTQPRFAVAAGRRGAPTFPRRRPTGCRLRTRRRAPPTGVQRAVRVAQGVRRWRRLLGDPVPQPVLASVPPRRHAPRASVEFDGAALVASTDATLYAERNWGAGFPERWWWGQAHDFDGADVSVAFSGGLLRLGPIASGRVRGGCAAGRPGDPHDSARAGALDVTARAVDHPGRGRSRYQIDLDGDGTGARPARAAGAAAGRTTQRRHRLRAPGRSASLCRARAWPGHLRRHLRTGRPRDREPARSWLNDLRDPRDPEGSTMSETMSTSRRRGDLRMRRDGRVPSPIRR